MKKAIIVLIFISLCISAWAQCPTGNITLSSQAQINSFAADYPGCTELIGSLRIEGSSITSLSALGQITTIGGDLTIRQSDALYSLSGLNNLTTIGGYFYVRFNDNLQNFVGLNSLTSISEYMLVQYNSSLSSVNGLNNLTSIGGDMDFYRNESLSSFAAFSNLISVNGSLEIEDNDNLYSLNGLDNIDANGLSFIRIGNNNNLSTCDVESVCTYLAINGGANIYGNASGCSYGAQVAASSNCIALTSCPSGDVTFTTQQEVDDFAVNYPNCTEITGNVIIDSSVANPINNLNGLSNILSVSANLWLLDLPSLSGLENLNNVGDSLIINRSSLTTLATLESLSSVGGMFSMKDNEALTSLAGLENLVSIGGDFHIADNDALVSLAGVGNLNTIGGNLRILFSHALNDLTGLENINTIGGSLQILSNNGLIDLNGLENISSIDGNVDIRFNDALSSLSSLTNLNSAVDSLWIRGNDVLITLEGLENINIENYLWIQGNSNLNVCGVQSICTYIENGGTTDINTNAVNCNTQAEVEATCPTVVICPQGNVTLRTQQEVDDFSSTYPGCTELPANLHISGYNSTGDINNLHGLSDIVHVAGYLGISYNDSLTSLVGLENLGTVGSLGINHNDNLSSLEGLNNLTTIDFPAYSSSNCRSLEYIP